MAPGCIWAQWLWHVGLVAPGMWDPGFQTRDQTYMPCIGRQILSHWATREFLFYLTILFLLAKKLYQKFYFEKFLKSGINFPPQSELNISHYKDHRTGWVDKMLKSLFWDKLLQEDVFQFPKPFLDLGVSKIQDPFIHSSDISLCNWVLHNFEKFSSLRLPGCVNMMASNPYLSL